MNEDQVVEATEKEMDVLQAEIERAHTEQRKTEALLQQEQETIRALEAVAVEYGYDMDVGVCLTEWLDTKLAYLAGVLRDRKIQIDKIVQLKAKLQEYIGKASKEVARLEGRVDHWKKKYSEKIFANE